MVYRIRSQQKALKYQRNKHREPNDQIWHKKSERLQEQVEKKIEAFVDQAITERLGEVETSEPKKPPTPKSTKKKAESPPKGSSDGSAQQKSAKKKAKKPTMKEIVDPDLDNAQKRRMKTERLTEIDNRRKAPTPAKASTTAFAKSSVGSKILGIVKGKSTQKEIEKKIEKLEPHRTGSANSVSSGRPPTAKKRGRGRHRKLTPGDKLFEDIM